MKLFDTEAVARLNRLGQPGAPPESREAIAVAGAPASVTGAGSMFRVHMKAEAPTDYRSSFPTAEEKEALKPVHRRALRRRHPADPHRRRGRLSTPMGEAEVDRLAEAVLSSLRKVVPG